MIEGMTNPAGGDGLGVFGKGMKTAKQRDIFRMLAGISEDGTMEDDEDKLKSFLSSPFAGKPSFPMYDPNQLYGKLYSAYGGQPVRGGLLGG
jgi:hypothetical protein